jgi:hypothetical protein
MPALARNRGHRLAAYRRCCADTSGARVAGMRRVAMVVVLVASGVGVWAEAPAGLARFPGVEKRVLAPGGHYAIVWVPADPARQGARHELLLEDLASGRTRPLRAFAQWVTVLWSPNQTRVAVTEGVGSDRSEVWVYLAEEPAVPVEVSEVLRRKKNGLGFAAGADHLYFEAVGWLDESTLTVRAWGFGGSKPFDRQVDVTVGE